MYFCEWELYEGTAPEQKTKSAKNSLDSMSKLFFNPSECNKLHPPPFAREAKKVYLFYSVRFSHFIDSLACRLLPAPFFIVYYLLSSLSQIGFVGLQGEQPSFSLGKNCSTGKSIPWKVSHGLEVLQLHSLSGMQ